MGKKDAKQCSSTIVHSHTNTAFKQNETHLLLCLDLALVCGQASDLEVSCGQQNNRELELSDEISGLLMENRVRHKKIVLAALQDTQAGTLLLKRAESEGESGELAVNFIDDVFGCLHLEVVVLVNGALEDGGALILLNGLALACRERGESERARG